ncbi:hypothetical protein LFYK43_16670 [Ligilactobacillus salitolerans]|uniref:Uncharacterized protein n=1 Tax=Ligilactobacillus salitolerans TaxID=1808352 RepID=A0A401IUN3_9LACO|nr:hypothetical protein [Ligilactobacillus salitolerans]GBG95208.1 hypothetical protein LFYK43_16670 [Ligilactobacillus salitolerans]
MTKYYRGRTQEQWDWLIDKLGIDFMWDVRNEPEIVYYDEEDDDLEEDYGLYIGPTETKEIIEVSELMEDEKMENEDYVTIKDEDLEEVHWETNYGRTSFIYHDKNGEKYAHEQFLPASLSIPKSPLYPKVRMTTAEKAEFDKLDKEMSLYNALTEIQDTCGALYERIYDHTNASTPEFELEFARAWADPSLIEVLPEPRWNVKVYKLEHEEMFYFKQYGGTLGWGAEPDDDDPDCQFTAAEFKQYGLDGDLFEKVEVQE